MGLPITAAARALTADDPLGVIGGAMLAFIISMDDLVITYFISGVDSTTLPVFIYGLIRRGIKPEINAIATLLLLSSLAIAAIGLYLRNKLHSATPATPDKTDHAND
ncbi:hypothetical protein QLQ85_16750 [Halomonas sp. M4R5S39]|uniref:ABC transporter permease n=1 Tax=Halomonas kalidii TaxID=3043293 RepID=UPI0024A812B2|nr:hypothetical protein [Halomonas kalidii]MDI5986443.1 hypothetical protein [Halomonas kalidii]